MFITITSSKTSQDQAEQVEKFLANFFPRLQQQPGVKHIYHYARPDKGDEYTVIIWENQEAVKAYRESDLIKEAIAFEKEHGMESQREGYPLIYPDKE